MSQPSQTDVNPASPRSPGDPFSQEALAKALNAVLETQEIPPTHHGMLIVTATPTAAMAFVATRMGARWSVTGSFAYDWHANYVARATLKGSW